MVQQWYFRSLWYRRVQGNQGEVIRKRRYRSLRWNFHPDWIGGVEEMERELMTEVQKFENKLKDESGDHLHKWPRNTWLFESNIAVYPNLPETHSHWGPKDKLRSYRKTWTFAHMYVSFSCCRAGNSSSRGNKEFKFSHNALSATSRKSLHVNAASKRYWYFKSSSFLTCRWENVIAMSSRFFKNGWFMVTLVYLVWVWDVGELREEILLSAIY